MNDYWDHVSSYTLTEVPVAGDERDSLAKLFEKEGWTIELRELASWRDELGAALASWFFTYPDYVSASDEQVAALAHVREMVRESAVPRFIELLTELLGDAPTVWEAAISQASPWPFAEGDDARYVEALDRGDEDAIRAYQTRYAEYRERNPPRPLVEQNFLFRSGDRLLLLELGFDD